MTDLESAFLEHREALLRFLAARGAGDTAEDLLQELWLRIQRNPPEDIRSPQSYLMRAANHLMIDRHRSKTQAASRERAWADTFTGGASTAIQDATQDRALAAQQHLKLIDEELERLGQRPAIIFRRHRIDGLAQRAIAKELGVSLSTVEGDLRRCYAALAALKERLDEA
ncbi:MAG: RNA polymerase sigma factor [Pseudomonadota bacterium]